MIEKFRYADQTIRVWNGKEFVDLKLEKYMKTVVRAPNAHMTPSVYALHNGKCRSMRMPRVFGLSGPAPSEEDYLRLRKQKMAHIHKTTDGYFLQLPYPGIEVDMTVWIDTEKL